MFLSIMSVLHEGSLCYVWCVCVCCVCVLCVCVCGVCVCEVCAQSESSTM